MRLQIRLIIVAMLLVVVSSLAAAQAEELDRTGRQWSPVIEWTLKNEAHPGNPFDLVATATFVHQTSGENRTTEMFFEGGDQWKFRFTATKPGRWTVSTRSSDPELDRRTGTIEIEPNKSGIGFVTHVGNKWARPVGAAGELRAFIPQFVMYGHPGSFREKPEQIDKDIATFLKEHGFTGFHVPVFCRWFDIEQERASAIRSDDPSPDPRTFEALEMLITKVHAAGGVVHLWTWGDESRRQTPAKWGINGTADRRLQRYIAARLGPLPGWTMGYGYDLWEWVDGEQLTEWHKHMHTHLGWRHMLGARASKNELSQLSEALDYASYEQHRPNYDTYLNTIRKRPTKPSFSEDRFRIRNSKQYRDKDYNEEMTRRGLWHSTMAGGVANIWGRLDSDLAINAGKGASLPYEHVRWIRTHADFFRDRFAIDMVPRRQGHAMCLKRSTGMHLVFYSEDVDSLRLDLSGLPSQQPAIAVDTKKPYAEIEIGQLGPQSHIWRAPYKSDWAIAVGEF